MRHLLLAMLVVCLNPSLRGRGKKEANVEKYTKVAFTEELFVKDEATVTLS